MWVQTTERGVYDDHKRDAHMPRWPREVHALTMIERIASGVG